MSDEVKGKNISGKSQNHGGENSDNKSEDSVVYPILDFKDNDYNRLAHGIAETLKFSKIKPRGGKGYKIAKRVIDIVGSSVGLIICALPIGVCALLVYRYDGGNPFFSQIRFTENGRPFKMYKIRSMRIDAEEMFKDMQDENEADGLAFKNENDKRIIPKLGNFIRSTSLDELPQFFNVLKGDMSIIGPRPPLPREVVLYTPEQMDRLLVKGGLACKCQVDGRSKMPFEEWVKSDIEYIKTRSLALDAKIFLKMIIAVIKRDGAE